MARRKPATVHGLIAVDKPCGVTSRAIVNRMTRTIGERRAGHTGTLDPDASGVLVIAFGAAAKAMRWLQAGRKSYVATVRFGSSTSTDDASGILKAEAPLPVDWSAKALLAAAVAEVGAVMQVPPAVSALKRDGVRDHERVRRGEEVKREPRPVMLYDVDLLRIGDDDAVFKVDCGAGFYVRAWARDLGERLGSAAHLTALRRTSTSGMTLSDCLPVQQLEEMTREQALTRLVSIETALADTMRTVPVTVEAAERLGHGQKVPWSVSGAVEGDEVLVVEPQSGAICVAIVSTGRDGAQILRVVRGLRA